MTRPHASLENPVHDIDRIVDRKLYPLIRIHLEA